MSNRYAILNDSSADMEPLVYLRDMNLAPNGRDVVSLTPSQARDVGQGLIEGARRADPAGELRIRDLNGLVLAELEFAHRIIGALVASSLTVDQIAKAEDMLAADPRAHDVGDGLVRYHERGDLIRKAGGNAELFRKPGPEYTERARLAERLARAERALFRAGFADHGGAEWRPPVGDQPPFDIIDALRDMITARATPLKLAESTTIATAIELLSKPRRAVSFAQSTGDRDTVKDATGDRRFWPIHDDQATAKWLFVAKGDAGDPASLTWCADDAAVTDAVGAAMFCDVGGYDWREDTDHADQVKGTAESLIEDGFVDFEGDPGLMLIRLRDD